MGFGYQVSAFPSEHKNRQSPHFPHPAPHSIRSGRRSREFPSNFPVVGRPRWSSLGGAACTPPGVSWDVKREVMAQSGWGEISAPPGEDPAAKAAREPGRAAEQRGTGHAQERGEGRGSRGCAQTRPTPQVCTQDGGERMIEHRGAGGGGYGKTRMRAERVQAGDVCRQCVRVDLCGGEERAEGNAEECPG